MIVLGNKSNIEVFFEIFDDFALVEGVTFEQFKSRRSTGERDLLVDLNANLSMMGPAKI